MKKIAEKSNPLKRDALPDKVAGGIIEYIKENNIQCWQTLPGEKEFADYFGVSRASVREGILKLKTLGILQSYQGYGIVLRSISLDDYFNTIVNPDMGPFIEMSPDETAEFMKVRFGIEKSACKTFLDKKVDANSLKGLKKALDNLKKDTENQDEIKFIQDDLKFHKELIKLAGNKVLSFIYDIMRVPSSMDEVANLLDKENFLGIYSQHEKIYNALVLRDNKVFELIDNHLYKKNNIKIVNTNENESEGDEKNEVLI